MSSKQPPVPSSAAVLSNHLKSTRKTSSPRNSPKPTKQKDLQKKDVPMLPPSMPSSVPPAFFVHPRTRHPPTSISALLKLNNLKYRATGEKHDNLSYSSHYCQSQKQTLVPYGHPSLYPPSSHSSSVKPHILHRHQPNQYLAGTPSIAPERNLSVFRPKIPTAETGVKVQDTISVPLTPPNKSNQLLSHDLANLVQSEIEKMNDTACVTLPTSETSTLEGVVIQRTSTDESTGSRSQNDSPVQYPCPSSPDTPATGDVDENDVNRPKVYVLKACVACKNSHVACDVNRPCQRCVRLCKADSCVDAERKKRGRPCSNSKNTSHADGGEYSGSDGSGSDSDSSMSSSVSLSSRHLSKSTKLGSTKEDLGVKAPFKAKDAVIGVNECDPDLFDIATALLMTSRSQDPGSSPQIESQADSQSETGEDSTGCNISIKAGSPTKTKISATEKISPMPANKAALTKNTYTHPSKRKIQSESNPNQINSSKMQLLTHEHSFRSTQIEDVIGISCVDESATSKMVPCSKIHSTAASADELPISETTTTHQDVERQANGRTHIAASG